MIKLLEYRLPARSAVACLANHWTEDVRMWSRFYTILNGTLPGVLPRYSPSVTRKAFVDLQLEIV